MSDFYDEIRLPDGSIVKPEIPQVQRDGSVLDPGAQMGPGFSRRMARALNSPILLGDFSRTEKLRKEVMRAQTWDDLSEWSQSLVRLTEEVEL